ncbi:MAG: hypothetical protein J1E82_03315 [Muribaculaceae bacterium]|nr:hypothetical protein [Muribaculaceae bacterium]
MKQLIFLLISVLSAGYISGEVMDQKKIYIPKPSVAHDTSGFDEDIEFGWDAEKWDKSRMVSTDNIVLFWAPAFGDNIATAPDFIQQTEKGETVRHNMKVDLPNLLSKLENFYGFFQDSLQFTKPGSKANDYKMMVMLDYSLEGTAFGGDYDQEIGTLWIAPNRVQDERLNCIAHELGHSFQSQIICDGEGEAWGGNGFFEMTSQWMLWQVNPEWQKDENYHLQAFSDLTHKAFLHLDNIYHSPYVIELWGEKHGRPFIAELFRQGKKGEDPAMTYMRLNNLSQKDFNDEMFKNYARLVNWDIDRVRDYTRGYTDIWHTEFNDPEKGWQRISQKNAPENYGFNVIPLEVPAPGKNLTVEFKGEAGAPGYVSKNPEKAGWRYGFVAVDKNGKEIYGEMQDKAKGKVTFKTPKSGDIEKLWLVVMGAPTEHWQNVDGPDNPGDAQWPYSIKINR